MEERFTRNIPAISENEQETLKGKCCAVIGCGGLGGTVIEMLARCGVGHIIAVDGDTFAESNLNRQVLSTTYNIGEKKAAAAKKRINEINPEIEVTVLEDFLTRENAETILKGADIVVDALDNVEARFILEDVCGELGLTLVHGAVSGWSLQAAVVTPGNGLLHRIYGEGFSQKTDKKYKTVLSFTAAACACIEAAEAVNLLCGRESRLCNVLYSGDIRDMSSGLVIEM